VTELSQSLECPHCRWRSESTRATGWGSRTCPRCHAPLVLAPGPAESLVRRYMHGRRTLAPRLRPPPL